MKEYREGNYTIYGSGVKEYREGNYTIYEDGVGNYSWFLNGQLHREDGPAIEYSDGTKAWSLNGRGYTESEHKTEMRKRKLDRIFG